MLRNYLKIALAVLLRRKFFTVLSLFGIALSLSVLLVATALLDHIFSSSPPEVNQSRTLGIYRTSLLQMENGVRRGGSYGLAGYGLLDRQMRTLPGVEKTSISSVFWKTLSYVRGQRLELFLKYTDAEFWEILRFNFLEGRPFTHDEVDGGAFVAVINEATKEKIFPGEPAAGRPIELDGQTYRVVGVVENVPILRLVPFSDVWVPQATEKTVHPADELLGMQMGLILARSRADFPQIKQQFASRVAGIDLASQKPFNRLVAVPETKFDTVARMVFSLATSTEDYSAKLLAWIVVVMVLFLVLPALNLVNLNVSRIMERSSEIGVRKAFGASSLTLVGQFVVENVVLTLLGGLLGLALAWLLLILIESAGWIPYAEFHLNFRIFGYALALALFFGLMSGVYPAWRMSRMNPVDALRGGA